MSSDSGLLPPGADRLSGLAGRSPASALALQSAYGQLPLHFEPNLGQFDPQVRYVARGGGYTLFLTDAEAVMVISRRSQRPQGDPQRRPEEPQKVEQAVVRMHLVGARQPANWEALEKQPGISNYFLGNDPRKWRTDVPNYGRVEARGVYRGIDLVCYGNQRQLEYDLEVAPGADPRQVRLAWEGVESLRLNQEGDLVLATRLGEVVQKRPRVYQEVGEERVEVASKYVLGGGNRVRFELARYDRHRRLLIDPLVLVYSTYLGGSGYDFGNGIAVDAAGSAYVTGSTNSTNFPTQSPDQSTYQGGNYDAFVTKLAPAGNALVYSTYVGGSGADYGNAIAVDAAGSAYVTGYTTSTNFPTQSPYQTVLKGGTDVFVTKLSPAGNALLYSTYLGGSGYDYGYGIAVDGALSAYVTGLTTSGDFPTQSPYQAYTGNQSVFVAKLTPAGNALVYSTCLGGTANNGGNAIAVDAAGSAYVTGYTTSTDFPTQSPYQTALKGSFNAFVTKLAPAGNALVYSTYLGGSGADYGQGIAVDAAGSAYVAGQTGSTNFPTQSPYQNTFQGEFSDAFVTKLAPAGNALAYSTFLGSGVANGIAVDGAGSAYVTGWTQSSDFPTQLPYQSTLRGGQNVFVTKLSPAGKALVYSTYLGGSGFDEGNGIAVDGAGSAYVTGYTTSADFPTESPYQATLNGNQNVFVTRLSAPQVEAPTVTTGSASGVTGSNAVLSGSVNPNGSDTKVWFVYGTNSSLSSSTPLPTSSSQDVGAGTSAVQFSSNIALLSVNTTYYFRAWAQNAGGTSQGSIASFTTTGTPSSYLISGTVTLAGSGLSGVTVDVSENGAVRASIVTTGSGYWGAIVDAGGTWTVTPSLAGYTFTPPSVTFNNLSSAQTQNFTANASVLAIASSGGLVNGASFQAGIVPNSWITIFGTNLSSVTDTWANAVVNGVLPASLDGVKVSVGGQPAYIAYISPTQINALAPNVAPGNVSVTVTNSNGTSSPVTATVQMLQPAFFQWGSYAVATRQDYSLAVKNGTFSGVTTVPAAPGDTIILWGTGFGPTNPPAPAGVAVPYPPFYYTANPVTVTLGDTAATVDSAVLTPGSAGLYQVAIQIPATLADGDYPVIATISGVASPASTLITVQE